MSFHLLTIGDNPNLAFYAWRLQATRQCSITMVTSSLDPNNPLVILSSQFIKDRFQPQTLLQSVEQIEPKLRFDVVILSVTNLQSFQDICTSLGPFIHPDSLIVVESTGYVSLEPFVASSFPKSKQVTVCSMMNEADVKQFPNSNEFRHSVLNQDQRIYLGTCTDEQKALFKVGDSASYARFYKLLQTVQEQLKGCISLLKLNNYKEFMTYQWKLALPRIVLNPLSVIFEDAYPSNLEQQILAKPLISGLVNEIFKIIKKMECKLIKGFENESNLLKNWLAHYPATETEVQPVYLNANLVFYNFYHQIDVDIDLLLLQPILLGDDHGVRTPYLENLYSIVCQLLKMNATQSIFFMRKNGRHSELHSKEIDGLLQDLASLRLEKENAEVQYKERMAHMQQLEATLLQRQQAQDSLVRKFEEQLRVFDSKIGELAKLQAQKEVALTELDGQLQQKLSALENLELRILHAEAAWCQQQQQQHMKGLEKRATPQDNEAESAEAKPANAGSVQDPKSKTFELLHLQTPDLSEYADVAAYGAALNGDIPPQQVPPPPHNSTSQSVKATTAEDLSEKEKELQRREQALLERERGLRSSLQLAVNYSEPYFDGQTSEQLHDVSSNYPPSQSMNHIGGANNWMSNGNGGYNNNTNANGNHSNGAQSFRQTYSLTGANPYNNQPYEANGYDQQPPHGLPPNGFPQNSLPPTLRNPQRYHQSGPQFNQQMSLRRPRVSSNNSGSAAMNYSAHMLPQHIQQQNIQNRSNSMAYQQQQRMNQHPQMQMQCLGPLQYSVNQAPHGPGLAQGYPGKKSNRRSAFPDQVLNIDYGGRGGMPTASGPKHKSMIIPGSGAQSFLPMNQPKKAFSGVNPALQGQGQGHLRLPNQALSSNSDSLTSHGSIPEDSSKPSSPDSLKDICIEVPMTEPVGKPLGGIAAPAETKKKKKRGFLKKH